MFWLLLFGFVHAYFIWPGDILVSYAICGYYIFFLRKKSIRTLILMSIILFIIPLAFNLMTYYGMTSDELKSAFAFFRPTSEQIATEIKTMQGSFLEQMPLRLEYAIQFQTLFFLIETFFLTL